MADDTETLADPCGCVLPWHRLDPVQCGGHGYWYALTRYTDPDLGTSWLGWARIPEVEEHAPFSGSTCSCGGWWNEHHEADQQAAEERIYRKSHIEGTETA